MDRSYVVTPTSDGSCPRWLKIHLGVDADFRPARRAHPALVVEGLDGLVESLRTAGAPVREEPIDGRLRAYVDDPFGNRIELVEPLG